MLKTSCLAADDALTPPARLATRRQTARHHAAGGQAMRVALEDFYATLSDEQKAQFEAIASAANRLRGSARYDAERHSPTVTLASAS